MFEMAGGSGNPNGGIMSDGFGNDHRRAWSRFLLMLTIGYCMLLNQRLKLLQADEDALRATIARTDHRHRNRRTRDRAG